MLNFGANRCCLVRNDLCQYKSRVLTSQLMAVRLSRFYRDKKISGLRQQQARLRAEMVNVEHEVAAAERRNQSPFFKAFGARATGPGGSVGVISAADDPGQAGDEFIKAPSGATYLLRGEELFEYDGGGTGPDSASSVAARARKKQVGGHGTHMKHRNSLAVFQVKTSFLNSLSID